MRLDDLHRATVGHMWADGHGFKSNFRMGYCGDEASRSESYRRSREPAPAAPGFPRLGVGHV